VSPDERVAVVTGGGSGIGLATCARLAADGFALAVLDVDFDAAKAAAGADGVGFAADVARPDDVDRAFAAIRQTFGRIDVLINNAGISGSPAATVCHETPVEEWDRVHAVNARGPFLCSRAALPTMLAQGRGQVITVASVAGQVAFPGRCAYTASKGAALMLAKSLAVDYAHAGIRSNAVCPGFVQTPMTQWRLDVPQLRQKVEANIPMGRVAQPPEIAEAIAILASDRLTYLTGHALVVDGGWTAL
jgi:NAD(P)-dependent dehydrogenase (short-subunit alcohol dehydrogenase family)